MARRGRKRKWGARERNGRAKRKPKDELIEERVRLARSQPHRAGLKSNDRPSEFAESSLGRLLPQASSSAQGERAAGEAFAGIVAAYRSVIEGPRPVRSLMPATASESLTAGDEQNLPPKFDCPSQYADPIERRMQIAGRVIVMREWPCRRSGQVCICAERHARYMRAYEAIAACGRRTIMAVIAVAVRGEEISSEQLPRGCAPALPPPRATSA